MNRYRGAGTEVRNPLQANRRQLLQLAAALLGAGVSSSLARSVLAQALPSGAPARDAFTPDQREGVAAIAERILPKTDTPGAIEAGVPRFIESMVADWYTETEREIFLDGLRALDAACLEAHGSRFARCTAAQRDLALADAERAAAAYEGPAVGFLSKEIDEHAPFFAKAKELTVLGYFTSEVGATQVLQYNPVPGFYDGAYPFAKVGTQWSS